MTNKPDIVPCHMCGQPCTWDEKEDKLIPVKPEVLAQGRCWQEGDKGKAPVDLLIDAIEAELRRQGESLPTNGSVTWGFSTKDGYSFSFPRGPGGLRCRGGG